MGLHSLGFVFEGAQGFGERVSLLAFVGAALAGHEVGEAGGHANQARAHGYRQAAAFLAGELTREEAVEQTIVATRRFARRQESWYRKDPRIVWVDHDDPDRLEKALAAVRT